MALTELFWITQTLLMIVSHSEVFWEGTDSEGVWRRVLRSHSPSQSRQIQWNKICWFPLFSFRNVRHLHTTRRPYAIPRKHTHTYTHITLLAVLLSKWSPNDLPTYRLPTLAVWESTQRELNNNEINAPPFRGLKIPRHCSHPHCLACCHCCLTSPKLFKAFSRQFLLCIVVWGAEC